ncbi:dinuclear metal center YbgI/SA1388 family protein [Kineococcus xinjiangensis]|uniref:GTP cyclohydrolase 1 type 2 homolog n=1 Tax=Kineococcus xinjiangensis TaxID=512762 RepID=A0A2S6IMF2_9ACTN|nr:Nif3-like dinuclear metal center hexameric protein [Kineococcus xinjiangensis]PPK95389.1 dinuclear metal center YbgI/SA1388 family protein [Kineococcus xinjiangensis]
MTADGNTPLLRDVLAVLEDLYPARWAQPWDAVGLVCGDPDQPVRRVLLAVDPVAEVVEEAVGSGADLLLVHHPLLLRPVTSVAATTAKGRVVHRLLRAGCALHVAHTNADAASPGVSDALAAALGLRELEPLQPLATEAQDTLVTFVPVPDAERVLDAVAAAGAGRAGNYERAAWSTTGTGTFTPLPGAAPAIGEVGRREHVEEVRLELGVPRARRRAVLAALLAAHPYEVPVAAFTEQAGPDPVRGIGRVGLLPQPVPLRAFAESVAAALPATEQGVRVAGDLDAPVQRIAVCGGSGDSLFGEVRAAGADAYVTADLRHHPASEAREHSGARSPALVDVAHWASEWPWLADCASRLRQGLAERGSTVDLHVSTTRTDPWTARVPSRGE